MGVVEFGIGIRELGSELGIGRRKLSEVQIPEPEVNKQFLVVFEMIRVIR